MKATPTRIPIIIPAIAPPLKPPDSKENHRKLDKEVNTYY